MEKFKKKLVELLADETKLDKKQIESILETPPDPKLGDFAFPTFSLAKKFKKNPNEIAQDLARKFKINKTITKVEVKGPYLNFFVNKKKLAKQTLTEILKQKQEYGSDKKKKAQIMVEFCSPNTNKPLHLGHLRNIFIGQSISKTFESLGHKVKRTCLVNDRGIHISKSMLAYQKFAKNKKPKIKPDKFVGELYVKYNTALKKDPSLEKQSQDLLQKWEQGDKQTIKLWKMMNNWVYQGFEQTYKELGVKFDKLYYESKIYKKGKNIVMNGLKKGLFIKQDGAIIAELEKYKVPNKVLIRADGTSIYITQDIYLAKQKFADYPIKKSIYVVGNEQNMHFMQLFKILEILGYKWAKDCHHLNYGMVNLPEGRMKSREGTIVDADDLIAEIRNLAKKQIKKRHKKLTLKELETRSKAIGDGALRFFILKIDPYKDMVYNPEESVSFEGETGPYVQYTHARICSILRKHKKTTNQPKLELLTEEIEQNLIRKLSLFPNIVQDTSTHYKPSLLCRYLIELSQLFNEFYHKLPVLKAEPELRAARIALIKATKQVIKNGLALLVIQAPERM